MLTWVRIGLSDVTKEGVDTIARRILKQCNEGPEDLPDADKMDGHVDGVVVV